MLTTIYKNNWRVFLSKMDTDYHLQKQIGSFLRGK